MVGASVTTHTQVYRVCVDWSVALLPRWGALVHGGTA